MLPRMTDPLLELDATTRQRLNRGEILVTTEPVPDSTVPRLVVRAVVEAPCERVWRLIDGCATYERTLPGIARSEELVRDGQRVRVRLTVKMPFPLRDLTSVTDGIHTEVPGERYSREWQLVEGDYHSNSGSWLLVPFDGEKARTLVVYRLHAEPKLRLPRAIKQLATEKAVPRLIAQIRRLATA
jgi:ribosome-associated toxin RatA of RatAB toxin-antitoxin module